MIHARAIIGKNCVIGSCVTIGGRSRHYEVPVIGDNVVIGANSVVLKDIPSNCVVVGAPARIIKENIDIKAY